jgi:hypothetical protein
MQKTNLAGTEISTEMISILEHLAKDNNEDARRDVAARPSTPIELLVI